MAQVQVVGPIVIKQEVLEAFRFIMPQILSTSMLKEFVSNANWFLSIFHEDVILYSVIS